MRVIGRPTEPNTITKGTTMSKTDHRRPRKVKGYTVTAAEAYGKRQPRPAPRRTGTRQAAVAAAVREG